VLLISPFVPHLAEECWAHLGGQGLVADARWPAFDPALAADQEIVLPVQVNGKRRGEIRAPTGAAQAEVERIALDDETVQKHLEGMSVRKVIVVPDRIVNIVAG
jgi:leucyl-tRNA synthetase